MEKKTYKRPEVKLELFAIDDIIRTSDVGNVTPTEGSGGDDWRGTATNGNYFNILD